ncbi:UNVERIFIED_CONTAM: hypothetical protein FKN15_075086 [Acipenser sinensis]
MVSESVGAPTTLEMESIEELIKRINRNTAAQIEQTARQESLQPKDCTSALEDNTARRRTTQPWEADRQARRRPATLQGSLVRVVTLSKRERLDSIFGGQGTCRAAGQALGFQVLRGCEGQGALMSQLKPVQGYPIKHSSQLPTRHKPSLLCM